MGWEKWFVDYHKKFFCKQWTDLNAEAVGKVQKTWRTKYRPRQKQRTLQNGKNVNDRNRHRFTTSEEITKAVYQNSKYDRIQGKCLRGYFAGECKKYIWVLGVLSKLSPTPGPPSWAPTPKSTWDTENQDIFVNTPVEWLPSKFKTSLLVWVWVWVMSIVSVRLLSTTS